MLGGIDSYSFVSYGKFIWYPCRAFLCHLQVILKNRPCSLTVDVRFDLDAAHTEFRVPCNDRTHCSNVLVCPCRCWSSRFQQIIQASTRSFKKIFNPSLHCRETRGFLTPNFNQVLVYGACSKTFLQLSQAVETKTALANV